VARLLQGSLSISGNGSTQRSTIQVMAGSFKQVGTAYQMTGRVSGSHQISNPNSSSNSSTSRYVDTLGSGSGDQIFGADGEYLVLAAGELDAFGAPVQKYDTVQVASRNDDLTTPAGRTLTGEVNGFASGAATNRDNQTTELFNGSAGFTFDKAAGTFNGSIVADSGDYGADFLDNPRYEQSYLTDQLIAGVDSWGQAYMVSSGAVAAKIFDGDSSASICNACDFMTWGWWGKQAGPESYYSVHLGNWIIGKEPVGALPSSGTATYNGNAVGTVVNNGAQYIATGAMTSTMNFGARNGTVAVSGYDGKSFSANVAFDTGSPRFNGSVTSGLASGSVTGAFASNGTDDVKGIMGNFTASDGGTWSSTGIFAGSR
jgi:trimeric autotransporter adhesin